MEYVLLTGMVIGFVELVKAAFDRNWRTVVIIAGSAVVGSVAGLVGVEGLNVATGIVIGLSASGAVSVAKKI